MDKDEEVEATARPASEGDNGVGVGTMGCPAFGGGNDEGVAVAGVETCNANSLVVALLSFVA